MVGIVWAEDAPKDPKEEFLREIVRSIESPPPEIAKKRASFSFISEVKRFYSKDLVGQAGETTKTTIWAKGDGQRAIRRDIIAPLPPPFIVIQDDTESWWVSCTGKWAVKNSNYYIDAMIPKDITNMLSYAVNIAEHPDSHYKLAEESEDTWTVDETPSTSFVDKIAQLIPSFEAHGANLAPEVLENPRLALIRLVINKKWRWITRKEIYSESGALWLQTSVWNLKEIPLDETLFKFPDGCEKLGAGDETLHKMFQLESDYEKALREAKQQNKPK